MDGTVKRIKNMKRKIKQIVESRDVMMGDIKIGQPLPVSELEQISPFVLLHHGEPKFYEPGRCIFRSSCACEIGRLASSHEYQCVH